MHFSISEIIAVCAIGSPVLVTFINCYFQNRRNRIDHQIDALNSLIHEKQHALSRFSYMYSKFLMEDTTGKSQVRENLFEATANCLCYVNKEDRKLIDRIEIGLRQGGALYEEKDFYKARDLLISSIDDDYRQLHLLVSKKPISIRIKSTLHKG